MMVSLDSARQWYPREDFVACNADHSQIAKLKRGENSIYPSVRWAIKKALLSAGDLYSEAKGVQHDEARNLGSVDKASTARRSFLQVSQGQSSMPSDDRSVNPVPVLSRSFSKDAVDPQIKKLPHKESHQSSRGSEIQSDQNLFNKTLSGWQTGIDVSKRDNTNSSSSLADSAETDVASVVFNKSLTTSKSTEPTTSLHAGASSPNEPEGASNPGPLKTEPKADASPALEMEDLSIATDDAKSMVSAIIAGDEEKLRELIQSYDIERKDDEGFAPLILAVRYRNEKIVRLFLEEGANPSAKDSKLGKTTLHWLCAPLPEAGKVPISETLIDLLLKDRPPLDVPNNGGWTPLSSACEAGEQLLAMKLIKHGANVRAVTPGGATPLHRAAFHGRAQMIPLLIANGAELEARAFTTGYTPLHDAACGQSDSADTIEQLLLAGADKEARTNKNSWTPLLLAAFYHNKACVASLLKSGANIEAKNVDGMRPLHAATEQGQLDIVKALLDHGANPTRRTFGGSLVGDKPSGMRMRDDVSLTQRKAIRDLLKDAEKAWKRSGKE